jgi:hypothetical protein
MAAYLVTSQQSQLLRGSDMRKVIYSQYVRKEGCTAYSLEPAGEALFHQFGVGYEEFESGPGNYSTAIIELDDGTIKSIPVEHIKFILG